ncbi:hypothetical protein, partial [Burkholderia ubonensis]|uniref:hypothetical protein n=1 Tax=Burkholderia ubonensis TaxID=101571 RepID=UPI001E2EEC46
GGLKAVRTGLKRLHGVRKTLGLQPGQHFKSVEEAGMALKNAEAKAKMKPSSFEQMQNEYRIVDLGSASSASETVLNTKFAVKRVPDELMKSTDDSNSLLFGTYEAPAKNGGFSTYYIKDGNAYYEVKPDRRNTPTLRLVDPRRPDAQYKTPIRLNEQGKWIRNIDVGLRGGGQQWSELSQYAETNISMNNLERLDDGFYKTRSLFNRLPGVKPKEFIEIDGTFYHARRFGGGARLIDHNNPSTQGPMAQRKNGKWIVQFPLEVATPGGRSITLSRMEKYPKSFAINGNSRFLIHENNVDFYQGKASVKLAERDSFLESYDKWMNNDLDLYRGLSTNHFSVQKLKDHGVLESEGNADIPTFTMGNSQKTRWLPTDLHIGVPASISVGNQSWLDRAAGAGDIPRGIVVKIRAGVDETHFGVSYINSGELVVQGPLTNNEFSIIGVTFADQANGIVLKSTHPPLTFNELPEPGPYPDDKAWTAPQVAAWKTRMQQWKVVFDSRSPMTIWPPTGN